MPMHTDIREFLLLVEHGLGKDPDMPVDLNEYAERTGTTTRTAYRHVRTFRQVLKDARARGLDVRVSRRPAPGLTNPDV